MPEGVENETPIHTALLLYKGRALRGLGLLDAARETLTVALRRKKGSFNLPAGISAQAETGGNPNQRRLSG